MALKDERFALRFARSLSSRRSVDPAAIFAAFLALYLLVNVVFATLFWLEPGSVAHARRDSVVDAFFFSIETLATVGYGDMDPTTLYGHAIAATEIVCGLAFTAIITGLTFVRFSRPQAKFVFARYPVVAIHNGKPTLMLRIGNGRAGSGPAVSLVNSANMT